MTLVDYWDSDDDVVQPHESKPMGGEETAVNNTTLKRKRQERDDRPAQQAARPAPSLPANFHALYAAQVRSSTSDDPSLHGGRQRQVPHVVGNWPSFIYLEWLPSEADSVVLEEVIEDASKQLGAGSISNANVQSSLRSDLGVRLPLHISMSSPLTLATNTKDDFKQDLLNAILNGSIHAFEVQASSIRWVSNFDRTRYFLIMSLTKPDDDQLWKLLATCNNVARRYGCPELYTKKGSSDVGVEKQHHTQLQDEEVIVTPDVDDKFHVSIAWTLAKPDGNTCILGEELHHKLTSIKLSFDDVCIKIGNIVSTIRLGERADTTSALALRDISNRH